MFENVKNLQYVGTTHIKALGCDIPTFDMISEAPKPTKRQIHRPRKDSNFTTCRYSVSCFTCPKPDCVITGAVALTTNIVGGC